MEAPLKLGIQRLGWILFELPDVLVEHTGAKNCSGFIITLHDDLGGIHKISAPSGVPIEFGNLSLAE